MNPKTSQDLFNKIRSQFSNIRLGDENGAATADPQGAVFFEFEFQEDADTFGSVSISLADGENMKVYYNRDLVSKIDEDSRDEWYAFLKELKDFAVEHQLRFDVRDITKNNLTKQDYENLADTNKTVNTGEMSEELARITKLAGVEKAPVAEGLTGTSKSSFENLDKTKLIIRHKGKVDETVPGARSRQIQSLYIENEDGERFKYPLTHLAGARAMTRHVANGGKPYDEFGQHIISTSEDIAKLNSFSRYVTNKDQLNDNAGDIIEQTKMKLENLRNYVRNLSKQSHYEEASKNFKTSDEVVLDDETVNKLREKFTMKNLDNRVEDALPIINKIMSELEATQEKPIEEYKDKDGNDMEPIDAPIQPPVDHGAIVQGFLTDPDSKLILRKDDTADKMLSRTKFTNKNTMLSSILSDIASRLLTKSGEEDRVANFASRVADEMEQENSATFKPTPDYIKNKKIAVQLAKRYIDDYKKMQSDPAYKDEIRMEPGAFNPKKDLKGKAKETEAFESWVDNITEQKPYVSMYKDDKGKMVYDVLDKDGKSAFKSSEEKVATDYLHKNFDKLKEGNVEEYAVEPKDKEIEKKDKENATKLDVTKADKMMNTTAYKRMKSGDDRYTDKTEGMDGVNENPETDYEGSMDYELSGDDGEMAYGTIHYKAINGVVDPNSLQGSYEYDGNHKIDDDVADEMIKPGGEEHEEALKAAQEDYDYEVGRMKSKFEGNQFAQAVQKAKAAGMKAGDKFKVGDQEYTLKDAIELAGLQLEDFYSEEEQAYDTQIDRIKNLAFYQ